MREQIIHASQGASLSWDPDRQSEIDVLTAFGMTDRIGELNALGGLMLSLKGAVRCKSLFYMPDQDIYANDVRKAADYLASCSRHHKFFRRTRLDRRLMMARVVITEKVYDQCVHCLGSGISISETGVHSQCLACKGDGKRRYDDWERMQVLFEDRIDRFVKSPARSKETREKYWDRCKAFHDDLTREYQRHYIRQIDALHRLVSMAVSDKAVTVGLMLERW